MLRFTKKFILGIFILGTFATAQAQEKKVESKHENYIKIMILGKDGKTHSIDEKFEGELPANVKKKLEELQAQLKAEGKDFNWSFEDGKFRVVSGNKIELKNDDASGAIKKMITIHSTGDSDIFTKEFDGEMSAELKKKIEELKAKGIDLDIDHITKSMKISTDGKFDSSDSNKHRVIVINSDDAKIEQLKGGHFSFNIDEDIEEIDGVTNKSVKVFIFRTVNVFDIEENDADIPENLRKKTEPSLEPTLTDLTFYPNPNNGTFSLRFNLESEGTADINIYDLSGKTIYSESINSFSGLYEQKIDLGQQAKGVYILRVSQEGKSITKKLVIE
ncbi:MAG: hypothetical protein ACJAWV_001976 [Flammeovirgaceae bacterium]|jgi:hypothetical protein